MLEVADVAPYLAERGLLGARAVVDGRLRVVDVSRRNRVFLVTADGEPCYVVKASDDASETGVTHEGAVLDRLRSRAPDARLMSFLPTPVSHDALEGVLVLVVPRDGRDLAQQYARGRFSRRLAREAGKALALLHAVPAAVLVDLAGPDPSQTVAVHRPDSGALHGLTAASVDLMRLIQGSDELCADLDELVVGAQHGSVVHGDVRWDNCLAFARDGSGRRTRLLLIDWELAAAGDAALDIGAYLADYLRAWQRAVGTPPPLERGPPVGETRPALPAMQPAVRSFWESYERYCGDRPIELSRTLRRALQFAGGRLILAALEEAQTLSELRQSVLSTLQLGANVLRRPDEAAAHVLGFRTFWGRT